MSTIFIEFFAFFPLLVPLLIALFSVCLGLLIFKVVAFIMDVLPFI